MVALAVLLFHFSASLICMTECLCRAVISQPDKVTARTAARTITLPCGVTHLCRNPYSVRWFAFCHGSHREIRVQPPKYSADSTALTIHSLQTNDSGVYYCSVMPLSSEVPPSVGNGTHLVVRGRPNSTTNTVLMWILFAVLTLYSLLILTLLISKKARRGIFRSERGKIPEKSSTRRRHFRAVVQELYGKRNLQSTGQNTASTRSHHSKFEHPHTYSPEEDVYQNM